MVAEGLAADLDRLTPAVRGVLGDARSVAPEVWLQRELSASWWGAAPHHHAGLVPSHADRIHMRASPDGQPPGDLVLAHELTHLLLPGRVRAGLPWAVEEALCEVVAQAVSGGSEAEASRWWLLLFGWSGLAGRPPALRLAVDLPGEAAPTWLGRLALDVPGSSGPSRPISLAFTAEAPPADEPTDRAERGVAFFVVQRVVARHGLGATLAGLTDLALSEPTEGWQAALAHRAGLPLGEEAWLPALLDDLEDSDAVAALDTHWQAGTAEPIPAPVVQTLVDAFPGPDPHLVHEHGRFRIVVTGTSIAVPVAKVTWLAEQLEAAWP